MNKAAESVIGNIGVIVLSVPIFFALDLALAWIPMLGWNKGLATVFDLPQITYWQAFWINMLSMWVVHRQTYQSK